jgi:glutamate 5-kinase
MSQTLVVKIGTSSLTQSQNGLLALSTIAALVETLSNLRLNDNRVILVSSGAVGVGCGRLDIKDRPRTTALKQAVAAVGQGRLIRIYDDFFSSLGQPIAQILLTRQELIQRTAYVNIYNTFQSLLGLDVIPIVNENDTVAVEELKFGDNDTLSALVASLVEADYLFLLTDVDRLYSSDPKDDPQAQPIKRVVTREELEQLEAQAGKSGSQWGTGGMMTKLAAARIATSAGVKTVITHGSKPENLHRILAGESLGTQFEAQPRGENARKRWIAYSLIPVGQLYLDAGAVEAIRDRGKSLLAAGITNVEGDFQAGEAVALCDGEGKEIARGLVNYSSSEIQRIQGHQSEKIPLILGYSNTETVVHRDNMVSIV